MADDKPAGRIKRLLNLIMPRRPPPPPERSHFDKPEDHKDERRAKPQPARSVVPAVSAVPKEKRPPVQVAAEFDRRTATDATKRRLYVEDRYTSERARETALEAMENADARRTQALERYVETMRVIEHRLDRVTAPGKPVYDEVALHLNKQLRDAHDALAREKAEIDKDLKIELDEIGAAAVEVRFWPQQRIEFQPEVAEPGADDAPQPEAPPTQPAETDWLAQFREAARSEPKPPVPSIEPPPGT